MHYTCRWVLIVTADEYLSLSPSQVRLLMEHDDTSTPPPVGPPEGPPPPSDPLPPPPSPSAVTGVTTQGVPSVVVGMVAAASLVVGLIIGGVGGALIAGDDGGAATEAATVSRASDRSPQSTTSTTKRPSTTSTTAKAPEAGTRTNPFPAGTPLETTRGIGIVVQSVDLNGDAAIAGANRFNDPPAPGNRFVLVNVKVTNSSDEPIVPWVSIDVEAIGSANQVRGSCSAVTPDALFNAPEIYPGGETSGNVCVEVPIAEIDDGSLLLLVAPSFGDPVFVKPQ